MKKIGRKRKGEKKEKRGGGSQNVEFSKQWATKIRASFHLWAMYEKKERKTEEKGVSFLILRFKQREKDICFYSCIITSGLFLFPSLFEIRSLEIYFLSNQQ